MNRRTTRIKRQIAYYCCVADIFEPHIYGLYIERKFKIYNKIIEPAAENPFVLIVKNQELPWLSHSNQSEYRI